MAYHVNKDDIPEAGLASKGGSVTTMQVYGRDMSMIYSERPDDYHSTPHVHKAEQMNFVLEGSLWIFREDEAILIEEGDFSRVPSNMVHWSKVEEGPCIMVSAYTPPYVGDKNLAGENLEKAVGLFGPSEEDEPNEKSDNIWASETYADNEEQMIDEFKASSD